MVSEHVKQCNLNRHIKQWFDKWPWLTNLLESLEVFARYTDHSFPTDLEYSDIQKAFFDHVWHEI